MRIGILTLDWPPHGGGMSRFCVETFRELGRRGHRLTAFTGHRGRQGEESIPVVPVLKGDLSTDAAAVLPHEDRIDIWHGWELGFGGLARQLTRPLVVTVHGNDLYRPQVYYRFTRTPLLHRLAPLMRRPLGQRWMCRRSLGQVACFLPNSQDTADRLQALYPMCRRHEVIHCGVSEQFFQSHEQSPGPARLLTVCSLSRVRPRKNIAAVLRALGMLQDEFDFRYDICGPGDMLPELRALADSLGLGPRTQFTGPVSDAQLAAFYRRADLFVLVPHDRSGDVEGFGIVYLEANAAGTPVLAAPTGGIPDAVCEGVSGFFAASPQPADIADALGRFLSGKRSFDEMEVRGWAESHRYKHVADKLEAVYRSL
jgi:phosphatidylinositol alpha-1,6-mannosyltransferase